MNNLIYLNDFFAFAAKDERISYVHVSLYTAIIHCWSINKCISPFRISKKQLMNEARINSLVTYHKCMWDLKTGGYIGYEPSYNVYAGSQVWIYKLRGHTTVEARPGLKRISSTGQQVDIK